MYKKNNERYVSYLQIKLKLYNIIDNLLLLPSSSILITLSLNCNTASMMTVGGRASFRPTIIINTVFIKKQYYKDLQQKTRTTK